MPGWETGLKQKGIMSLAVELADPDKGWYSDPEGSAWTIGIESKVVTTRQIVIRMVSCMVADTT